MTPSGLDGRARSDHTDDSLRRRLLALGARGGAGVGADAAVLAALTRSAGDHHVVKADVLDARVGQS